MVFAAYVKPVNVQRIQVWSNHLGVGKVRSAVAYVVVRRVNGSGSNKQRISVAEPGP